ncbi:MAG: class I SAM-dependent methyltransferase [Candidatus Nitrospinota bacterium M3_3B_026]
MTRTTSTWKWRWIESPRLLSPPMSYRDYFSERSSEYATYRPDYPVTLFDTVAGKVPGKKAAWDAGCGTGKAAGKLADYFDVVVGTDISLRLLEKAAGRAGVHRVVARAEECCLKDDSVDLVTVAQALHWFDLDKFYREAKRVLRPGGAVAAWVYGLANVSPEIDGITSHLYEKILGPYWPPERRYIDEEYRTIPFDFEKTESLFFTMQALWTADMFLGYLGTWSSVKRFRDDRGYEPLERISSEIAEAWGGPEVERIVHWPIFARMGWVEED